MVFWLMVFLVVFYLSVLTMQEEPVDKTKHWGDLEEEEEVEDESEEMEEEELEAGIQSVDSLSRY